MKSLSAVPPMRGGRRDEPDLFSPPPAPSGDAWARTGDPSTSHDAANEQRGAKAKRLSALVLHALTIRGPSTSKEVAAFLGMETEYVSLSPRFRPLANKGDIQEFGKREGAIVWRIKPAEPMEAAS